MKTYFAVDRQTGVVVNAVVWDGESPFEEPGCDLVEALPGIGMGWVHQGGQWNPPPEPEPTVPNQISMRQARLTLLAEGLLSQVDAAIDGLPEPDRTAARIEWEYAENLQRHHPLVASLAGALGLTEEAVDDLFIKAAQV